MSPRSIIRFLTIAMYSVGIQVAWWVLRLAAVWSKAVALQLEGRESAATTARRIAPLRAQASRGVLFFCSSAGEFEQAKPLIDRFTADGRTFVHVVFFSRSGWDYARKRGENVSMSLSPADTLGNWGRIVGAVHPEVTIVVRHELWPGFLEAAASYGRVMLVDGVLPESPSGRVGPFLKRLLMRYFDLIFVVDEAAALAFHQELGVPRSRIHVTGDTKFDRVLERARQVQGDTQDLRQWLDRVSSRPHRLVLGSAWPADVDCWLEGRKALASKADDWLTIIAPHDVGDAMISGLTSDLQAAGLTVRLWSELRQGTGEDATNGRGPEVIVVDTIGQLAEIYAVADAAWVGGALHHRVHNVLEPACYGLALAFGPRHGTSNEAVKLVASGHARVIHDGAGFAAWWAGEMPPSEATRRSVLAAVESESGAAASILATIEGLAPEQQGHS